MNRKEMNPSGRPGRSYEEGNGNGCPVRKEASWVTRVSQKGTRQDGNQKRVDLQVGVIHSFLQPDWLKNVAPDGKLFVDELNAVPWPTQRALKAVMLSIHESLHAKMVFYRR